MTTKPKFLVELLITPKRDGKTEIAYEVANTKKEILAVMDSFRAQGMFGGGYCVAYHIGELYMDFKDIVAIELDKEETKERELYEELKKKYENK